MNDNYMYNLLVPGALFKASRPTNILERRFLVREVDYTRGNLLYIGVNPTSNEHGDILSIHISDWCSYANFDRMATQEEVLLWTT